MDSLLCGGNVFEYDISLLKRVIVARLFTFQLTSEQWYILVTNVAKNVSVTSVSVSSISRVIFGCTESVTFERGYGYVSD